MTNDMELVRAFAEKQSEQAFQVLLSRHINLVYSAALRQVCDVHLAEEVTQAVFIILARKADSIKTRTALSGWLYRTAHYVSADALKMQRRRRTHEQEAYMQSILLGDQAETIWAQMLPQLDAAMAQLRDKERDAIVLRYFENKSLREVGEVLGLEERTAQKRIQRAVEKLRTQLVKRGVVSTTAIITGLISANSVQAAPLALAKTISVVAMGKGAAAGSLVLALVEGGSNLMAWAKVKISLGVSAAVILLCGTAVVAIKEVCFAPGEDQSVWTAKSLYSVPPLLILRQTKLTTTEYFKCEETGLGARFRGQKLPLNYILGTAYDFSPHRIVFSAPKPDGYFDFIATVPNVPMALQAKIQKELNLVGRPEIRTTDCLLLQVKGRNAPGLKPPKMHTSGVFLEDGVEMSGYSMENWAATLENILERPVIDRTKIDKRFDISLKWHSKDKSLASVNRALLDQLGLELVPSREPLEVLVVEKTK